MRNPVTDCLPCLPRVPLRLSRNQLQHLEAMVQLAGRYRYGSRLYLPEDAARRIGLPFPHRAGNYHHDLIQEILCLAHRLYRLLYPRSHAPQQKYRINLNALELSMIRFAVTHYRVSPALPRQQQLLQAIDRFHKKALRQLPPTTSSAEYAVLWRRWREHACWMRNNLCRRWERFPPFPDCVRRMRRRFIDGMARNAIRGLQAKQVPLPDDRNLRHWMRLLARYIRRGRIPFGFTELVADQESLQEYLAQFVTARMKRLTPRRQPKPRRKPPIWRYF
jgi:hypothetical protein